MVDLKHPQPTQIDGDPLGTTPIIADLLPKALPIVVPRERQRGSAYLQWLSQIYLNEDDD